MSAIVVAIILVVIGFVFGRMAEKRHYRSIIEREKEARTLPAIASRYPPEHGSYQQQLVTGNVVIASDYFKSFVAALISIFGGSIVSYEAMLDRGRREAILRMKSEAEKIGAKMVFNVKLETSTVGGDRSRSIEVLAYGTALIESSTLA